MAELLRLKPDALVMIGIPAALAARKLTTSVPIVFLIAGAGDPVAAGLVPSLSRPGGNITGFMADPGPEVFGKRVQYLKEAVPGVARIAFVGHEAEWNSAEGNSARTAAQALSMRMIHAESAPNDYSRAFETIVRERADAILVGGNPAHYAHHKQILEFAARRRLPDMHAYSTSTQAGGLISYSTEGGNMPRVAANLDRILKGAKPGDLPVERPTRFTLTVNLKTARALGIAIPQAFLLRADRVIE